MGKLFCILFAHLLFIVLSVISVEGSDYFTLEQYYQLHPEQRELAKNFEKIVHDKGEPIEV